MKTEGLTALQQKGLFSFNIQQTMYDGLRPSVAAFIDGRGYEGLISFLRDHLVSDVVSAIIECDMPKWPISVDSASSLDEWMYLIHNRQATARDAVKSVLRRVFNMHIVLHFGESLSYEELRELFTVNVAQCSTCAMEYMLGKLSLPTDALNALLADVVTQGTYGSIEALIREGADVHMNDEALLKSSYQMGHFETVLELLKHGADLTKLDDNLFDGRRNLLLISDALAVLSSERGFPASMLAHRNIPNGSPESDGDMLTYNVAFGATWFRLIWAIFHGRLSEVMEMAQPTYQINDLSYLAALAASRGHYHIVKYILENYECDEIIMEAIVMLASVNGHASVAISMTTEYGYSGYLPAMLDDIEYVRFAINNVTDLLGSLQLLLGTARYGYVDETRDLIGKHRYERWELDAALCNAVIQGDRPMVELLIDAGADPHVYDDWLLSVARRHNYAEVEAVLLERGSAASRD